MHLCHSDSFYNLCDTGETRLYDNNHTSIYNKLVDQATQWRTIGIHLGFKEYELDNIQSDPKLFIEPSPTNSYLRVMLSKWLQWAPGDGRGSTNFATEGSLYDALLEADLGQLAKKFE